MKKLLFFGLMIGYLSLSMCMAQIELERYVITPIGAYDVNGVVGVSWTTGQVETETFQANNGTLVLTQGFQQPELIGVSIEEDLELLVNYTVFPNPTPRILKVHLSTDQPALLQLEIVNLLGQPIGIPIQKQQVTGTWETEFDLQGLAEGYYLLTLRNQNGKAAYSWKIHKQD